MLTSLLPIYAPGELRDQFVIAPYHSDRLRRPPARFGAINRDRFLQAVTWNVFRTLELIGASVLDPKAAPPARLNTLEWTDLGAILEECHESQNLSAIERVLARNALEWLRRAGDGLAIA